MARGMLEMFALFEPTNSLSLIGKIKRYLVYELQLSKIVCTKTHNNFQIFVTFTVTRPSTFQF
jgi:hypothetical protein